MPPGLQVSNASIGGGRRTGSLHMVGGRAERPVRSESKDSPTIDLASNRRILILLFLFRSKLELQVSSLSLCGMFSMNCS